MRTDDAYTDWQVHYETCIRCRPNRPCREGQRLKDKDDKEGGR